MHHLHNLKTPAPVLKTEIKGDNMNGTEIITILKTALPAVQTTISAIGGAIFTAIFLRKNTSTEEFEKLKAGKLQEVADDLLESGKMTFTEYYKAGNFLSVAKLADEEYSKTPHNESCATYDFDWFMRFYEAVGDISDEEMQLMWAKIMAGEINKPKSFSLRTLDVMRNLSKQDANLFAKVCKHCFQSARTLCLPNYDNYLENCNITYSEILRLDEIGLLNSSSLISLSIKFNESPASIINQSLIMLISAKKEDVKQCSIKQFPFTHIGSEIATLIGEATSDEDFILFAKEVSKDQSINVSVHKINYILDDSINYDLNNLLNE